MNPEKREDLEGGGNRSDGSTTDESSKKRVAQYDIFRRSKKINRSPTTTRANLSEGDEKDYSSSDSKKSYRRESNNKEKSRMEDKIDHLTNMMASFVTDIKASINEIKYEMSDLKKEVAEVKKETEKNDKEIRSMKDANREISEKLEEEVGRLKVKSTELESKLEKMEREKIRNNVVLSGIVINEGDPQKLKAAIENLIKEKMGLDIEIGKAYKVGEKRCVFELNKWEDKLEILKSKNKLMGSEIYMDSDLTPSERVIMREIRERARKERERGNRVKVGHLKLIMTGKVVVWDEQNGKLIEKKTVAPDPVTKN